MRCNKCDADNREGARFCDKCGARLSPKCASCGTENRLDAKFCDSCGAALGLRLTEAIPKKSAAPQIRIAETPSENVEGERKTITALFADIKGSMELMEDLDPEEARAIVDPALKLMIEAVQRYDGYVVQSTGDGIFALFGAPVAHEDHPQRALYAALRMQEELRRYSSKLVAEGANRLQCRVGVNTGEVVVRSIATGKGHAEYTPIGHTTNLASRMQAVAPVGSIAVAESTRKLCEGYFVLKSLGPTRVKGVTELVNVYEVAGLGSLRTRLQRAVGRGLAKFVGRHTEMEAMKRAAELAKSGHGQMVAAVAEAGVGKSRLFYEFKAITQSGWMVLEALSVSHAKASAYLPVIDLLHGYFRFTSEDDARRRREKITGRVLALDRALEDALGYLLSLLGLVEGDDPLAQMEPGVKKRRTLEVIKRILLRESLNQPLMMIFEDLHWIDEQTQEFLDLLADSIGTAKILLLVNYRPEYSHQWYNKTYYTQLRLDPLGGKSAEEMLVALLGRDPTMQPLHSLIIDKTEGNPFFMEETVQVLLDEGTLVRDAAVVKLTKPVSELKIPPTVQAILVARIDRLPAGEKDLLQTLAVIGKKFPLRLVRKVTSEPDDELELMLGDLQLGEFIYEQPALPDVEYTFKHGLTHEVAYSSVLNERRRRLHERTAEALESLFADQLDDHLPEIARHYSRSGNINKAVHYLRMAGEQAGRRCAHEEAISLFNSALEILKGAPEDRERMRREVELRLDLIGSLVANKGYATPEVAESVRRALELSGEIGKPELHFSVLMFAWSFHQERRDLEGARETSRELIELAERVSEPAMIVHSNFASGAVSVFCGELHAGRAWLEQAATIHDPPLLAGMPQDSRVTTLSLLALTLWLLGYPAAALGMAKEAVRRARSLRPPMSLAFALSYGAMLHLCRRDPEAAHELANEASRVAMEHGLGSWSALASTYRGIARAALGRTEEGIAETLDGMRSYRLTGSALGAAAVVVGLVTSYLKAGRPEEALSAAEQQLSTFEQTGARMSEAELYRLKADALLMRRAQGSRAEQTPPRGEYRISDPNVGEAEQCFRHAIAVATKQGAKSWELRATTSLAQLLRDTGRRDEARAILAEIYNWFTEGFDTADLKEAKALLDELGT